MRFIDCVTLHTVAGHGGAGAVAYRKEKFVPTGGPVGGNGGRGGNVSFVADRNVGTLLDLRYRKEVRARNGQQGGSNLCDGSAGQDVVVRVPVGTLVRLVDTDEILADLTENGDTCVVAKGGRGGKGNAFFKTSVTQTPTYAQPGEPGEEASVVLEIKLLADIGIMGFPSVGKSTLISVISNAKPKIAAYQFTTLVPNLGMVGWRDDKSFVVADIPGLIEGAHEGRGLGYQFLRHVERCRALCHVIEVTPPFDGVDDGRDPIADFEALQRELALFSPFLAGRPQFVALAKMDLPFAAAREAELRAHFEGLGYEFYAFSAVTRKGLQDVLDAMGRFYESTPAPDPSQFTAAEADFSRLPQADDGVEVVYMDDDGNRVDALGQPLPDEEEADDGAVRGGAVQDGAVQDGAVHDGAVPAETVHESAVPAEAVHESETADSNVTEESAAPDALPSGQTPLVERESAPSEEE